MAVLYDFGLCSPEDVVEDLDDALLSLEVEGCTQARQATVFRTGYRTILYSFSVIGNSVYIF